MAQNCGGENLVVFRFKIQGDTPRTVDRFFVAHLELQFVNGRGFSQLKELFAVCFGDVVADETELRPTNRTKVVFVDAKCPELPINARQIKCFAQTDAAKLGDAREEF